jgi:hypothetical protein
MFPPLLANAGIPMICVGMPALVFLFFPVVFIEALWYCLALGKSWRECFHGSLRANLWSTFLGIPIAWVVWSIAQHTTFGLSAAVGVEWPESRLGAVLFMMLVSGWLWNGHELAVLGATLVLMLPCYLVSYIGEARKLQSLWPDIDPKRVHRQCWLAHLMTYSLLYAVTLWRYLEAVESEGLTSLIPTWSAPWY